MEKDLVEKKLARLEGARGQEIAELQSELETLRGSAKEQLKEKEARINSLVEELSKTQSLLSEKEVELEGVRHSRRTRRCCHDNKSHECCVAFCS